MSKINLDNRGFTLIELLVSVAIVGVLASIAVPSFNEYKEKTYSVLAKSALHNMHLELEKAIADSGSVPLLIERYEAAGGAYGIVKDYGDEEWTEAVAGNVLFPDFNIGNKDVVASFNCNGGLCRIDTTHCKGSKASTVVLKFGIVPGCTGFCIPGMYIAQVDMPVSYYSLSGQLGMLPFVAEANPVKVSSRCPS